MFIPSSPSSRDCGGGGQIILKDIVFRFLDYAVQNGFLRILTSGEKGGGNPLI